MNNMVECYSGHEYAVRPLAIHWQEECLEVETILNAWRTPQGKGFRVRIVNGQVFDLLYDLQSDHWSIQIIG